MAIVLYEEQQQFQHYSSIVVVRSWSSFLNKLVFHLQEELLGALLGKDYKRIEKADNNTLQ